MEYSEIDEFRRRAHQTKKIKKENIDINDDDVMRKKVWRKACTSDSETTNMDDDVIERTLRRSATMGNQRKLIPKVNYVNSDVIPSKKLRKTPAYGLVEKVNLKSENIQLKTADISQKTKKSKDEDGEPQAD